MDQKPLVKNAADERQVNEAGKKVQFGRERELADLGFVMSTPQGRRVMWKLLSFCKTFNSVWEASAKIHYNSGQQDVGHFLMAEIMASNEDAYLQMAKEAKKENTNV